MQWTSQAIIIKQQQFSDDKLLCWLFSQTHGVYKGLLTLNNKTRSQIQVGNLVEATWKARLPEHLGSYYLELLKPLSISILEDKHKLTSVSSICSLLSTCLPERVLEKEIYEHMLTYLLSLKEHKHWLIDYLKLEVTLLQELGYGLGLNSCAVSGQKEGLYYVSPKTGKAVTKEVGAEYHEKLLRLPSFFINEEIGEIEDIIAGFKLTRHFLAKNLYKPHNQEFPGIRIRFEELYTKPYPAQKL